MSRRRIDPREHEAIADALASTSMALTADTVLEDAFRPRPDKPTPYPVRRFGDGTMGVYYSALEERTCERELTRLPPRAGTRRDAQGRLQPPAALCVRAVPIPRKHGEAARQGARPSRTRKPNFGRVPLLSGAGPRSGLERHRRISHTFSTRSERHLPTRFRTRCTERPWSHAQRHSACRPTGRAVSAHVDLEKSNLVPAGLTRAYPPRYALPQARWCGAHPGLRHDW